MVSVSNAQKTPFARSLNRFAEQKAAEAIQLTGRALPCSVVSVSGSIVTVKFEVDSKPFTLPNVTVPVGTPEYVRLPIQAGDKGVVLSSDAYLGGVSGLGGGTADLSIRANLSCLVFFPISNKGWSAAVDANALCLYGPDGTIIYSTDKTAMLKVTKDENSWTAPAGKPATIKGDLVVEGSIRLAGSIKAQDGSTYAGDITTAGNIVAGSGGADQVGLRTHTHPGPGGNTGAPNAGT